MNTPVLSKIQQKKTLSAKKGPIKGLKNVLAQSSEIHWPILKNTNDPTLENLLKKLLPVKKKHIKLPWSKLQKMSKEERIATKKELLPTVLDDDKSAQKSIVFGINSITKLIEKENACCVLLDSNIDFIFLIKHIVIMARNNNIPVILIPFLKKVSLETSGFATGSIALKNCVKDNIDDHFHTLYTKVSEISRELSASKTSVTLFKENMEKNDNKTDNSKPDKIQPTIENTIVTKDIVKHKPCNESNNLLFYRTSTKERVFIPPLSARCKAMTVISDGSDYIKLSNDCDVFIENKKMPKRFFESVKSDCDIINSDKALHKLNKKQLDVSKNNVNYKPLKVKRLRGNESRIKTIKPNCKNK